MPTTAQYRRYAVGVLTKVTTRDPVELSSLDLHAHVEVPVRDVSAFLNAELARAIRGPMQLVTQLLEYLEACGGADVTQQEWLQRAAADVEVRYPEDSYPEDRAAPAGPARPEAPKRRTLHMHGIRRR